MWSRKQWRIRTHGIRASAVVVAVREHGRAFDGAPRVKLLLEVRPEDRPPFQVTKKVLVYQPELPRPGQRLWVRYLPWDVRRVEFDRP